MPTFVCSIEHMSGSKAGRVEQFRSPIVTVGRDPSNILVFDPNVDVDVSSRHAQIVWSQGIGVQIQDLQSRNGTFLNGQPVTAPVPIVSGSLIQFGKKGPQVKVMFAVEEDAKPVKVGPGRKTMMIEQLQTESTRMRKITIFLLVLVFVVIGGGAGFNIWLKARRLKQASVAAQLAMEESKGRAVKRNAESLVADKYGDASSAQTKAEKLFQNGEYELSRDEYVKAKDLWVVADQAAEKVARERDMAENAKRDAETRAKAQTELEAKDAEHRRLLAAEEEKRAADIEMRRQEFEALNEKYKKDLKVQQDINRAQVIMARLAELNIKIPTTVGEERKKLEAEREKLLAELKTLKDVLPTELIARLEALQKERDEQDRMEKIYKSNARTVVYVRSTVFVKPTIESPPYMIARADGSGFLVEGEQLQ